MPNPITTSHIANIDSDLSIETSCHRKINISFLRWDFGEILGVTHMSDTKTGDDRLPKPILRKIKILHASLNIETR